MKTQVKFGILIFVMVSCSHLKQSETDQTKKEPDSSMNLKDVDFTGEYDIEDKDFGNKTKVTLTKGIRKMVTNGLPNHTTGEFPNPGNPNSIRAQKLEYEFPIKPKFLGKATWARELGVAINGVKFEPETAERFICENGETYRVEAIQDLVNLGLDFNYAHVQPTGAYHYHGVPTNLIKKLDKGKDMILVGYAHDGFPMYYSKSGAYKPSYKLKSESRSGDICSLKNPTTSMEKDFSNSQPNGIFVSDWEFVDGSGDLDECNGTLINGEYRYIITNTYPYVGRCLKGEFEQKKPQGPPPGRGRPQGHGHRH